MSGEVRDFRVYVLKAIHGLTSEQRDAYLYGVLSGLLLSVHRESMTIDSEIAEFLRAKVLSGLSLTKAVEAYNEAFPESRIAGACFRGGRFTSPLVEDKYWQGFEEGQRQYPFLYWAFDFGDGNQKLRTTRYVEGLIEFVQEEIALRSHVHSK